MKRLDRKKRSDYNYEMDKRILDIFQKRTVATIEWIRKDYNKIYKTNVSWDTILEHLRYLEEKCLVKLVGMVGEKKRIRIWTCVKNGNCIS